MTISIMVLALFCINFLITFGLLTKQIIQIVENKTSVYVDLTPETTPDQAKNLVSQLNKISAVKEASFVEPEQALEEFLKRHSTDPLIKEAVLSLTANPLKGSILIKVNKIADFPALLNDLSKPEFGKYLEINDQDFLEVKNLINQISQYTIQIKKIALGISLLFIIIAIIVVFNTIQVGIYTHKDEIGIMKLVGATNSFVRSPFLIEGIICSIVSLIVIILVTYPLFHALQPKLDGFLQEYSVNLVSLLNHNFFTIFGAQFLVAAVITFLSSLLAVRRYLKV
ncbi:MAG: permease-like cell division protein FtsX [Candidatus Komeilibacteria bacterium]|nr:permease-like cell division protein FtsX [Candidatus Komeilibacteria bacterium]